MASDDYTDLHSHLVPGVDDGSRTLPEALAGLDRLMRAGVRRIVTTPHLDGSLTRNGRALNARLREIDEAWERLLEAAEVEFPGLECHRGHEVMLDIPDPDLSDPRLRLAGTAYALVEWPNLSVPPNTGHVLERMAGSGLRPILAHPERYRGLDSGTNLPGEWRAQGALLQVNYGSLVGKYGALAKKRAMTMVERGWVDLMASDFHGRAHLSPCLEEAREALTEGFGRGHFDLLAGVNPTRILRGEDPLPVPPIAPKSGVWRRFREAFQSIGRR